MLIFFVEKKCEKLLHKQSDYLAGPRFHCLLTAEGIFSCDFAQMSYWKPHKGWEHETKQLDIQEHNTLSYMKLMRHMPKNMTSSFLPVIIIYYCFLWLDSNFYNYFFFLSLLKTIGFLRCSLSFKKNTNSKLTTQLKLLFYMFFKTEFWIRRSSFLFHKFHHVPQVSISLVYSKVCTTIKSIWSK